VRRIRRGRGGRAAARGRRRETGRRAAGARDAIYSVLEWVPRSRRSLRRGDGEGFLVHGEKNEGIGNLLEMVSSPYDYFFLILGRG
jgi:hypothetical protein